MVRDRFWATSASARSWTVGPGVKMLFFVSWQRVVHDSLDGCRRRGTRARRLTRRTSRPIRRTHWDRHEHLRCRYTRIPRRLQNRYVPGSSGVASVAARPSGAGEPCPASLRNSLTAEVSAVPLEPELSAQPVSSRPNAIRMAGTISGPWVSFHGVPPGRYEFE